MSSPVMTYRAICVHGKVQAMTVDDSLTTQHCLRDLREFRKWADAIDHVDIETARQSDLDCEECKAARRLKRAKARKRAGLE